MKFENDHFLKRDGKADWQFTPENARAQLLLDGSPRLLLRRQKNTTNSLTRTTRASAELAPRAVDNSERDSTSKNVLDARHECVSACKIAYELTLQFSGLVVCMLWREAGGRGC